METKPETSFVLGHMEGMDSCNMQDMKQETSNVLENRIIITNTQNKIMFKNVKDRGRSKPKKETSEEICVECGDTFCTPEELSQHKTEYHKITIKPPTSYSQENSNLFMYPSMLDNSLVMDVKEHQCQECEKSFSVISQLETHINTVHKDNRPHVCEFCGKGFTQKRLLSRHVNGVHLKLRSHKCKYCGSWFSHNSHLKEHLESVHEQQRPFICEDCGKSFSRMPMLKSHIMNVHQKLRPYECKLCGKFFGQSGHLRTHITSVHKKINPHQCPECGKTFDRASRLEKHCIKEHTNAGWRENSLQNQVVDIK